ncbi:serine/threonine protein kinase [Thermosporothrix hazakensis]|jgi:serine/threonine protein kinase|uniref:non-specific serine/threonine protein kinase n=2 Tax=Thermosporothrix TaxID=768650 RepID=A0A326U0E7_THEHA|nr:serine/threonine-protein kinase [Thermosporothrix hazakensis]PZW23336.1 serine/threonine protein kinase [Thermosporothrix hazakensis]BBH89551.1 hypothetical protein KTC_43020 [Thermosporothrix sp. COM3]GCE47737.1 hypothetical protein KTH_26060 [Thermosporothrix hazakensis]
MREVQQVKRIKHYHIQRHLAKGGMSDIYLARDPYTEELVAIKLVHCNQENYVIRFLREIQMMEQLHHDHILPVLDHGKSGPWYYMVTPFIPDGTLREYLQQGPLSLAEAGELLEQLASALHYAHTQGFVHRDIKPSNILLRDKHYLYLADFGLIRRIGELAANEEERLTDSGYLIGTPDYMAPELVDEEATPQSDLYALGVLLYQMLTGRLPFKGNTASTTFLKHIAEDPVPPSKHIAEIPPAVDEVILRALAKDPHERFSSVREFAQAYQAAVLEGKRPVPHPEPDEYSLLQAPDAKQFRPMLITAGVLAVPLLLLSLFSLLQLPALLQEQPNSSSIQPTAGSHNPTPMGTANGGIDGKSGNPLNAVPYPGLTVPPAATEQQKKQPPTRQKHQQKQQPEHDKQHKPEKEKKK